MATREEVIWLYRCLLHREPESDHALETQLPHDFESVRAAIMASEEFLLSLKKPDHESYYRPPSSRPGTLALACIVKNEAVRIERMIRSCLPIIDFVSIVDTGSVDETVAVTRRLLEEEMPTKAFSLVEAPFENFALSRNRAIDLVPLSNTWIIMLDADEHLVKEDYGRLQSLLYADVDAWQLPRLNFNDKVKILPARPYPDFQRRLFRNLPGIRFVGSVHERLDGVGSEARAPASSAVLGTIGGPHIHHMGQVDLTQEAWQTKHDFYTKLALSADLNSR